MTQTIVQVLKPISPLAWMPLALYTIKDSSISGIFVIFICSVWPMLINTAFGVSAVKREWLNVAITLEVTPLRNHLVDFLVARSKDLSHGHAPAHPDDVTGRRRCWVSAQARYCAAC